MPILRKLKELLDERKIPYQVYNHPPRFTAQEIAAVQHIPGKEMAKVVILKVDGSFVMAVLPATRFLSLGKVKAKLGAHELTLATEEEFAALFPECEVGAMPPFGNMFGLPVYMDPALEKGEYLSFNAGNHWQTMRLKYQTFKQLVQPEVLSLTEQLKKAA